MDTDSQGLLPPTSFTQRARLAHGVFIGLRLHHGYQVRGAQPPGETREAACAKEVGVGRATVSATAPVTGLSRRPSCGAEQRPVRTRHQYPRNCRPMATTICLRLALVVLGLASTGCHLATGR
jgi:hypothetical protein